MKTLTVSMLWDSVENGAWMFTRLHLIVMSAPLPKI